MKKSADPPILPASTLSPEFVDIFTKGIPASVDGDPAEERGLSALLSSFDATVSVRFGKRTALYREWLGLPGVTIPQACYLLIGRDPLDPHSQEPEPSPADMPRRQLAAANRLECEVVKGTLKPIGRAVPGFERRFKLSAVAHTAARVGIEGKGAAHILMLTEADKAEPPPSIAWQTERVNARLTVHRKLVELIRAKHPEAVVAIAPKKRPTRNRRTQVEAINVQLDMPQREYEVLFRETFPEVHGGKHEYPLTSLMLDQDRDQLNVKFRRGRRPATD